ncbi:MAG: hypothetical protein RIT81_04465 [Deltaproteobacteria bacterium]
MRAALIIALSLVAGCALEPDGAIGHDPVPAGLSHFAWVFQDASGAQTHATPLLPAVTDDIGLRKLPEPGADPHAAATVRLYGFSAEQIMSLGTVGTDAVRLSGMGDPLLPTPAWHVAGEGGTIVRLEEDAAAPPLTADWIASCPLDVPVDAAVQFSCATQTCAPLTSPKACELDLPLADCGAVDWRVTPKDGGLAVSESGCEVIGDATSALSIGCATPRCRLDVYEAADPLPVMRIPVVNAPDRSGDEPTAFPSGYLGHAALLSDRVVVASHDGLFLPNDCISDADGKFEFFALTGEHVATSTAPPCVWFVEPEGDGFYATFGSEHSNLGRFDPTGKLVETFDRIRDLGTRYVWRAFMKNEQSPSLSGLVFARSLPASNAVFLEIDPVSKLVYPTPDISPNANQLLEISETRIGAYDPTANQLQVIDLDTNMVVSTTQLMRLCDGAENITRVYWDATTDTFVGVAGEPAPAAFTFDETLMTCNRIGYSLSATNLDRIASFTESRVLIGGVSSAGVTSIALYDAVNGRMFPGHRTAGRGPIGNIAVGRERHFATLPFTGELLVIGR